MILRLAASSNQASIAMASSEAALRFGNKPAVVGDKIIAWANEPCAMPAAAGG
jgi:hypothetical protein